MLIELKLYTVIPVSREWPSFWHTIIFRAQKLNIAEFKIRVLFFSLLFLTCEVCWAILQCQANAVATHKTNFAFYFTSDAANNLVRPHIVPFEDFYNNSLERCDLLSEYYKWQNVYSHGGYVYDEILLMCIESIFPFFYHGTSQELMYFS